ncbi:MAG: glycoside hydrolase family 172 protein, partial [Bacteroidales bacterium]
MRCGYSPGRFANSDYSRFIREENNNGRREFVLFDHTGPGAVVRWWMTFAGEGSYDGTIRVYIDGAEKPAIEGNAPGILSGKLLTCEPLASSVSPLSEYLKRGHNLYLPIPYSGGCKITYECDAVTEENGRIRPSIYYNINYREYEEGTRVVSFSGSELQKATDVINRAAAVLSSTEPVQPDPEKIKFTIQPGESYSYTLKKKKTAINSISLTLEAADLQQALRSTVVTASFDGRQTVWVPAGDFFGTGTMISPYETFYSRVEPSGEMVFERIMPFKKSFELTLVNYGDQVVEGEFSVSVTDYGWRPASMYFGSSWHEYRGIKAAGSEYVGGTGDHFDINFIDINGKGVYVGDEVVVFNTEDAWWGEGDEKIFVDGDTFPSSFGTGTEDYYGYAWCLPGVFSHPFIAQPRGDGNFHPGLTVDLRHRSLDAIPFRDNISSNIELWHWAPAVMNYALTTWYYTLPGSTSNQAPDPESVMSRVARSRTD